MEKDEISSEGNEDSDIEQTISKRSDSTQSVPTIAQKKSTWEELDKFELEEVVAPEETAVNIDDVVSSENVEPQSDDFENQDTKVQFESNLPRKSNEESR